ncbi:MAG: SDR family NAD(P)-dependent oxidoreductase [Hyphomicrobiaceae bacterium]|nr:SDR family NAD(P)-dependent oxidoreductase [Hyphomicrobiaceae bacterium]
MSDVDASSGVGVLGLGALGAATFDAFPAGFRAVVIGASGGIGGALASALEVMPRCGGVVRLARSVAFESGVRIDLTDEASIASAAASVGAGGACHLILTAVGVLRGDGLEPEKSMRALDPHMLARSFAINALGPALVIKHFAPLLPKAGPCALATISAKVGSIGDNRLGGWYGYRASKAALNQLIRTAAVEISRTRPEARVLALHPGTVATRFSQGYAPDHEVFSPDDAARRLLAVVSTTCGAADRGSGRFLGYDGREIAW